MISFCQSFIAQQLLLSKPAFRATSTQFQGKLSNKSLAHVGRLNLSRGNIAWNNPFNFPFNIYFGKSSKQKLPGYRKDSLWLILLLPFQWCIWIFLFMLQMIFASFLQKVAPKVTTGCAIKYCSRGLPFRISGIQSFSFLKCTIPFHLSSSFHFSHQSVSVIAQSSKP